MRGDNVIPVGFTQAGEGSPPRAWGQLKNTSCDISSHGSPPRAWGQLLPPPLQTLCARFTPTCVGTTPVVIAGSLNHVGSPPRAWGQLVIIVENILIHRFTPTCVGTTNEYWYCNSHLPVHPHVRGDNQAPHRSRYSAGRFTPTCVGTTQISNDENLRF